jgi:hypothetical protein
VTSSWFFFSTYKDRNIQHAVKRRKVNWIGQIFCRNCLMKQVTEVKVTQGGRERERKKLLDDCKEKRGSWWTETGSTRSHSVENLPLRGNGTIVGHTIWNYRMTHHSIKEQQHGGKWCKTREIKHVICNFVAPWRNQCRSGRKKQHTCCFRCFHCYSWAMSRCKLYKNIEYCTTMLYG